MAMIRTDLSHGIFTIPAFLSPDECSMLIDLGETLGFEKAGINTMSGAVVLPDYRNNDRVIWDDAELAVELFERVAPLLPEGPEGQPPVGLNERWRLYRYEPGQEFKTHRDGSLVLPPRVVNGIKLPIGRSLTTLLIYLNDDCTGGETTFYHENQTERLRVTPTAGTALCFLHDLLHAGCPVLTGKKYVLRTDIFYKP